MNFLFRDKKIILIVSFCESDVVNWQKANYDEQRVPSFRCLSVHFTYTLRNSVLKN